MSLNHGCIRVLKNRSDKPDESGKKVKIYQSTSPDEITLVNHAKACGFEFLSSNDHRAKVRIAKPNTPNDLLLDN